MKKIWNQLVWLWRTGVWFTKRLVAVSAALTIFGVLSYSVYMGYQGKEIVAKVEAATSTTPSMATKSDTELESIINDPSFQAAVQLKARQIRIERQKTAEEARHDAQLAAIEADLEQLRKDQLTLGDKGSSF